MDATIYVSVDTVGRQLVIHGPLDLLALLICSVREIPQVRVANNQTNEKSGEPAEAAA